MNFAQDIQSSLDTTNFIKLVRPLCVLTQGASFIADTDIIFQGLQQFNNIGLVLSAAKDKDNTQLFKTPTTYQAVLNLITNSEYSSGLINVAAELTAANIIRSLPLNDSLKLIERGNTLEQRAYSNLDRIIFLYTNNNSTTTNSSKTSKEYFFFAPELDKTTIPASAFDVGLETDIVSIDNVKVVPSITVDPNHIAFIYFNILKSEPGTPPLLNEGATQVFNGETIENIVFRLTSDINALCTSVYTTGTQVYPYSNLIAAPTRTTDNITNISLKKKDLYPLTTTFKNKTARFNTSLYSVYIEFTARRLSTLIASEAIIVRPITIHKGILITGYVGTYNSSTTYINNNVVIYNNNAYRCIVSNSINIDPTNTTNWLLLDLSTITYTSSNLVNNKNNYLYDYINGLVVGVQSTTSLLYQSLQPKGPLSAIIDVNKGVTSTASSTTTNKTIDHKVEIDTFYFGVVDSSNPQCTQAGKLLFRISTLSNDVPWIPINIIVGDKPEDVAFKLVQKLLEYRVADDTHVVGAQIYNNAVYINAYKISNPEVKVVVDVKFEGVGGITVAAYYHLEAPQSTAYNTSPRSVAVTTILRITNNPPSDSNINKGASTVDIGKRGNSKMSKVRDKIGTLNDVTGSQYVWNRSSMY